jgi:hypothetical protein
MIGDLFDSPWKILIVAVVLRARHRRAAHRGSNFPLSGEI